MDYKLKRNSRKGRTKELIKKAAQLTISSSLILLAGCTVKEENKNNKPECFTTSDYSLVKLEGDIYLCNNQKSSETECTTYYDVLSNNIIAKVESIENKNNYHEQDKEFRFDKTNYLKPEYSVIELNDLLIEETFNKQTFDFLTSNSEDLNDYINLNYLYDVKTKEDKVSNSRVLSFYEFNNNKDQTPTYYIGYEASRLCDNGQIYDIVDGKIIDKPDSKECKTIPITAFYEKEKINICQAQDLLFEYKNNNLQLNESQKEKSNEEWIIPGVVENNDYLVEVNFNLMLKDYLEIDEKFLINKDIKHNLEEINKYYKDKKLYLFMYSFMLGREAYLYTLDENNDSKFAAIIDNDIVSNTLYIKYERNDNDLYPLVDISNTYSLNDNKETNNKHSITTYHDSNFNIYEVSKINDIVDKQKIVYEKYTNNFTISLDKENLKLIIKSDNGCIISIELDKSEYKKLSEKMEEAFLTGDLISFIQQNKKLEKLIETKKDEYNIDYQYISSYINSKQEESKILKK